MFTKAQVDAALDAWYVGESWRKIFDQKHADNARADMRAALEAAARAGIPEKRDEVWR